MISFEQTHVFYNRQEPIEPTPILLGVATPITVQILLTVQLQLYITQLDIKRTVCLVLILSVKTLTAL